MKRISKRIWIPIAAAVLAGILIFSLVKIFTTLGNYNQGDAAYAAMKETISPPVSTEREPTEAQKFLQELQKKYPGAVGWITIGGTKIDYPVMQADNNEYYLETLADGTKNNFGSIFLDYRNNNDMTDRNLIIYGHAMNNGSMFGTLKEYRQESYYKEHPTFQLYTPQGEKTCEIFSVYQSKSDGFCYMVDFKNDRHFDNYLTEVRKQSFYSIPVEVSPQDQIVTLSTCTGGAKANRYIIQAKMINENKT